MPGYNTHIRLANTFYRSALQKSKIGIMTVEEYEAEFDRLSQYAPSLREDENSKFHHFAEGLKNHIRRAIILFLRLSYVKVVNIAKDLEIT